MKKVASFVPPQPRRVGSKVMNYGYLNPIAFQLASKVDWSQWHVCPGCEGSDFYWALSNLTNPSATERERAYWMLDNVVIVQGGMYDASYPVTAVILKLLETDPCNGWDEMYELLEQIVYGDGGETLVFHKGSAMALKPACLELIVDAMPLFESHRDSGNAELAKAATELLSSIRYIITGEDDETTKGG